MSVPKVTATSALNEPFHPHITTLKGLQHLSDNSSTLSRGYIKIAPDPTYKVTPAYVSFLYNPSMVSTNYGLDTGDGLIPPYLRSADQNQGTYRVPLNQTVAFSLLFDRTYELYDAGWAKTGPGQFGVEYDVMAFKKLVGIYDKAALSDKTELQHVQASDVQNGGVMLWTQVLVYLGDTNRSLRFYGVIQSLAIDYTHWTQLMVPQRATVSVSLTLLPTPSKSANGTGFGDIPVPWVVTPPPPIFAPGGGIVPPTG